MNKLVTNKLTKLPACKDAVEWAKKQPNKQAAWEACERGDWMLWLLGKLSGKPESKKRKKLVLASCDCAALALKYSGKNRKVCEIAIRTARKWVRGTASIKEVRSAAADAAAYAAAAGYAAAYAAASAADAGYAAAKAAYAAADAAAAYAGYAAAAADDAAAYAAAAAAADAAAAAAAAADSQRTAILKKCAKIVRKHYPNAPIL